MDTCDVLVVGGGPAGSTCARELRRHGLDVVVIDKAQFPRDKVCAGWITPQVVAAVDLDLEAYRRHHTLEPITGFRIGVIGEASPVDIDYGEPVSYGILRCEFDAYLLSRAGARVRAGEGVTRIERRDGRWIVNGTIATPLLVGAGGHRCPVARLLRGDAEGSALIHAQEAEYVPSGNSALSAGRPELYFLSDLTGYGWCLRKGDHLNVGFGRINSRSLADDTDNFVRFLRARHAVPDGAMPHWRAHAYLLASATHRPRVGEGVVLIGDAAGLAQPASGEGIGPAVESARLAAAVIADAHGHYTAARLRRYGDEARRRFGRSRASEWLSAAARPLPLRRLITTSWFARGVLLDRGFLRRH